MTMTTTTTTTMTIERAELALRSTRLASLTAAIARREVDILNEPTPRFRIIRTLEATGETLGVAMGQLYLALERSHEAIAKKLRTEAGDSGDARVHLATRANDGGVTVTASWGVLGGQR